MSTIKVDTITARAGTGTVSLPANNNLTVAGTSTFTGVSSFGEIRPNNIASTSGTNAMTIASGGQVTFATNPTGITIPTPAYQFIAKKSIDIGGTAAFALLFNNTEVTSAFNNYRLVFNNLRPTNNGSQLYVRLSIDNGNSGLSNNQGQKTYFRLNDGHTGSEDDDGMNTHEIATNIGSDQYDGVTGIVDIFGTGNNSINLQRTMVIQSRASGREDSDWYKWDGAAYVAAGTRSSMVNCIFFLFNAGNIADGSVCLYGMNES